MIYAMLYQYFFIILQSKFILTIFNLTICVEDCEISLKTTKFYDFTTKSSSNRTTTFARN